MLTRRLGAPRPAELVTVKTARDADKRRSHLAREAATRAVTLAKEHSAIGVVVNRVDTARKTCRLLQEALPAHEVLLVTGRMRAFDREHAATRLARVRAGRTADEEPSPPMVVVATQCIEAGADLDFDGLVTECASLDALRQRVGRLNRLGERDHARAFILHQPSREDDPIYGAALEATADWLAGAEALDFGLDAMDARWAQSDEEERRALLSPKPDAPVLLPTYLDLWTRTHPRPWPDPTISPWLHGAERSPGEVQLVWRDDLWDTDGALRSDWQELLAACPPRSQEALTVPLHAARAWLRGSEPHALADVAVQEVEEDGRPAPQSHAFIRWRGEDSEAVGRIDRPRRSQPRVSPGETLVVPSRAGGIDPATGVWDPQSHEPVQDHGDLVQLRQVGRVIVRAHRYGVHQPDAEVEDPQSEVLQRLRARSVSDQGGGASELTDGAISAFDRSFLIEALDADLHRASMLLLPAGGLVLAQRVRGGDFVADENTTSFTAVATSLSDHLEHVRSWVSAFSERLGLPRDLASDLALAAWLHDLGKADPRFQQLLSAGDPVRAASLDEPLAKSAMGPLSPARRRAVQEASGYPRGTRHEIMSLALIEADPTWRERAHDWELVCHLVASHHGWCRPAAPPVPDPEDVQVRVVHDGRSVRASSAHALARADSPLPERFRRLNDRYGPYTLAWFEALLRLADHRASEHTRGAP